MKLFTKSKILILALVLILSVSVLAACGSDEDTNGNVSSEDKKSDSNTNDSSDNKSDNNKLEGTVEIAGSTSVQPVAEKLAEAFMDKNSGLTINVQGIGSSAGVKAANQGTADIGTASRNLKSGEEEWGVDDHVIAYDGIAVVVNNDNPISDLDKETIVKIFKGEISNWKEAGGDDEDIIVVSREAGSGTRGAFEDILDLKKEVNGKEVSAVVQDVVGNSNGAVKQNVVNKKNAIGYISFAYLDDKVKGLKVSGTEPTVENVLADKYNISRPFLMITKGEVSKEAQAFLDFVFSPEGQKIVGEEQIPVK